MIEKLTKKQIDRVPFYVDKWLKIGLSTENSSDEEIKKIINDVYENLLSKPKPKEIKIFDNPIDCWNTVGNTVRNTVRNTVENTVRNTVWNTVWNTVENTVWNTVRDTVENTVGNFIYPHLDGHLMSSYFSFYDYFINE
jgi:hypothetical protein